MKNPKITNQQRWTKVWIVKTLTPIFDFSIKKKKLINKKIMVPIIYFIKLIIL